jgi:hypothetical protein
MLDSKLPDGWIRPARPPEFVMSAGANVADKRRAEAREALATRIAHAPVDDAVTAGLEHPLTKLLRGGIRLGIIQGSRLAGCPNVYEPRAEVREVHTHLDPGFERADLSQLVGAMKD